MADDVDQKIAAFARALEAQQIPLGREFTEVLHANLWELYEEEGTKGD